MAVNVSILFLLELRMKEMVASSDNYTMHKALVKLSPPTNQLLMFYRPDALPVTQPAVSEH